jgi:hypothetical protein
MLLVAHGLMAFRELKALQVLQQRIVKVVVNKRNVLMKNVHDLSVKVVFSKSPKSIKLKQSTSF